MKAEIHPNYHDTRTVCACGSTFGTRSTYKGPEMRLEICSVCHPFYTGRQKLIDTEGSVGRFQKKLAATKLIQEKRAAATKPTVQ